MPSYMAPIGLAMQWARYQEVLTCNWTDAVPFTADQFAYFYFNGQEWVRFGEPCAVGEIVEIGPLECQYV